MMALGRNKEEERKEDMIITRRIKGEDGIRHLQKQRRKRGQWNKDNRRQSRMRGHVGIKNHQM